MSDVNTQVEFQLSTIIRYLVYIGLIVGFGLVIRDYYDQLENIVTVLQGASWYGIGIAVTLLVGTLIVQAQLFRSLYHLFGLPSSLVRIGSLYLMTRFINVAVPSGGLAGMAPFIQDAKKRDLPQGQIIIINLTYIILWYSAFALFLMIGLIELFIVGQLAWFEVVAGITLFVIIIALIGIVISAGLIPKRLLGMITGLLARYGRYTKRPTDKLLERITAFVDELHAAFDALQYAAPYVWLRLFGLALLNELLNLSVLFTLSWTFNLPFQYGTLVAAYSIGILFFILSPTPGGLGFVEGILLLVFTSLGHTQEGALLLMLSYRGITFWLPFLLGFIVTLLSRLREMT